MEILIAAIFILGYLAITLEHSININKAATALVTGVLCWTVYILASGHDHTAVVHHLNEHMGEISEILFFLMGAMVIVELIDAHDGFDIITERIRTTDKRKLLWITSIITFFLSAILDNLTTTIVMVSLLRKLIDNKEDRMLFVGITVVAANAGGAWSPMGDVTTTMLWIGGQITAGNIIKMLFLPSLVCLLAPLLILSRSVKGKVETPVKPESDGSVDSTPFERKAVFAIGVGSLVFVPVFKTFTHLPPFMGILLGLGVMWILTELIHKDKDEIEKGPRSVNHALRKIDTPSILFFLGILVAVAALQSAGMLTGIAGWLDRTVGNITAIGIIIGFLSAIVDNVPLVAAAQGMYSMDVYPTDHFFWEFLAYCTGTGGSALIIGSAAGVAAMGMEKIDFFWYFKRITVWAVIGYLAGAAVYVGLTQLVGH
ncbi:MAG: sodium:proton antiporter NhaD [Saprospiraceae bacterium]|nr:sodium:proton antiporter NhaD [Saprospiraceae bacterium]